MRAYSLSVMVLVINVLTSITGCATKGYVDNEVNKAANIRMHELEVQIRAVVQEIETLKQSDQRQNIQLREFSDGVHEALARAEAAGKLAEGKFLYAKTFNHEFASFGFARSGLSKEMKVALDDFANRLKIENKNVHVEIQGHTDSTGPKEYNYRLGLDRASEVRGYLHIQHGIPLHRMSIFTYGDARPIVDNNTPENRAKNRRVTLVVLE